MCCIKTCSHILKLSASQTILVFHAKLYGNMPMGTLTGASNSDEDKKSIFDQVTFRSVTNNDLDVPRNRLRFG